LKYQRDAFQFGELVSEIYAEGSKIKSLKNQGGHKKIAKALSGTTNLCILAPVMLPQLALG
jgi:hypothetical protein